MVAKITTPHSILRVLNYNEKKVQKGAAECIYAGNFLLDAKALNFYNKLFTFKHRTELNQRATTNMLHISLNFDPTEKLSQEKLISIASAYIQKIGFAAQPFLVYQHHDAGHPHVHIITTSILENGKRINTFNIGKNQSEIARKEIEIQFNLIKASGRKSDKELALQPLAPQKIKYGFTETKRSITNVLDEVINHYKYTSIPELNAILKLYNLIADRGSEDGRIYKNRGLTYRIIDSENKKIGVPIKASSIYSKPTLNFLEQKFMDNEKTRVPDKRKLKTAIDWTLSKKPSGLQEFIKELQREKINVALRRNDKGFLYGISFIDHRTKSVFNGSDLGKSYSASGIRQRLINTIEKNDLPDERGRENKLESKEQNNQMKGSIESAPKSTDLIQILLNNERNESRFPNDFLKKKRKRRKRNL
jgi:hypothetical protein